MLALINLSSVREPIGLMQVAGRRGKCSHLCYFAVRRSDRGKFLTGSGEKRRKLSVCAKWEKEKVKTLKYLVDK